MLLKLYKKFRNFGLKISYSFNYIKSNKTQPQLSPNFRLASYCILQSVLKSGKYGITSGYATTTKESLSDFEKYTLSKFPCDKLPVQLSPILPAL